jgi:hypothetical protein
LDFARKTDIVGNVAEIDIAAAVGGWPFRKLEAGVQLDDLANRANASNGFALLGGRTIGKSKRKGQR